MTPPMPSDELLDIAIAWLEVNESENGTDEREACLATARWLAHLRDERLLRTEARLAGVPVAKLRELLAEQAKATRNRNVGFTAFPNDC